MMTGGAVCDHLEAVNRRRLDRLDQFGLVTMADRWALAALSVRNLSAVLTAELRRDPDASRTARYRYVIDVAALLERIESRTRSSVK